MLYIDYVRVNSSDGLKDALKIREQVFVKEQRIKVEDEIDEYDIIDLDKVWHFVGYSSEVPVCTARVIFHGDKVKIGRVAVRPKWRGQMVANDMLMAIEMIIREMTNCEMVYVESQVYIKSLYEKLGYKIVGQEYIEVETGISHIKMEKIIEG